MAQVAQRMGHREAFDYDSAHAIFAEHAALSGEDAAGNRAFDISAMAEVTRTEYDGMQPIRWPLPRTGAAGDAFTVADRFYHADRRARFIATPPRPPVNPTSNEFPLVLNTGRIRDQWHTMTRSARSPRLVSHITEAYVDLHRSDADRLDLREGLLAKVTTRWGSVVVRVRCSGEMQPGAIFVPIHWSDRFCSQGRVGALVNPVVDPISGEPEFKHTPARVERFEANWYGFALTRTDIDTSRLDWWSQSNGVEFIRTELAGREPIADVSEWASHLLSRGEEHIEYRDGSAGIYRVADISRGRLQSVLFTSRSPDLPDRGWLSGLFRKKALSSADRDMLLLGESPTSGASQGPVVCSCFGVPRGAILSAIAQHSLKTPHDIGRTLRAGTNCGSCLSELKLLLACAASA